MSKKNNLDEMQEQKLLKIESRGCWLAFWGLAISLAVQSVIYGPDKVNNYVGAEYIVFMLLALYLSIACLKAGIWDRRLRPTFKDNLIISFLSGLVVGIIWFFVIWKRFPDKPGGSIAAGIFSGGFCFALILFFLTICAHAYKKKQDALEEEPKE